MINLLNKRPIIHDNDWLKLMLIIWVLLFSYSIIFDVYKKNVSVTKWYEIQNILIFDSEYPNIPNMVVNRFIHEQVRGEWLVTVMRKGPNDKYYLYCTAEGNADYIPDNELPEKINLDWWTWPTKCILHPGTYYITTIHTFYPDGYPPKISRITSNEFKIS